MVKYHMPLRTCNAYPIPTLPIFFWLVQISQKMGYRVENFELRSIQGLSKEMLVTIFNFKLSKFFSM